MEIVYQEINDVLLKKMIIHYANMENTNYGSMEETIRGHLHFEEGSYSLVALHDDTPVGFISTYTQSWTPPLENKKDAYIDIIEVDRNYRRKGIASGLISRTEKWAQDNGFIQIRSWSSQDKLEAISMWHSLNYCMCPAKIWVEWCKEIVDGFYVAKKLN